jgi:hypothetical protein
MTHNGTMSGQSPDFDKHEPPEQPPEQPRQGAQSGSPSPGAPHRQPGFPGGGPTYGQYGPGPEYVPGYGPWAPPPEHPGATTAMVLGIVSLAGGYLCLLPLVCGPFAWVQGHRVRREIDAEPGRWSGRGKGTAAMVMGIIATVGLVLAVLVLTIVIVVAGLSGSGSRY